MTSISQTTTVKTGQTKRRPIRKAIRSGKAVFRAASAYMARMFRDFWYLLSRSVLDLMRVQIIVSSISWVRYLVLARILKRTRVFDLSTGTIGAVAKNTINHNMKGLQLNALRAFSGERPNLLLRLISTIETVDPCSDNVLFIGPRAESELLLARGYGFKKARIRGLDLISYSPRVDLGDMHKMPYADNQWDIFVLGWVLAYSQKPIDACNEVIRTARNGAIVAVGVQYHPLSPQEIGERLGYIPGADRRLESCDEILNLFGNQVGEVYVRHDIHPDRRDQAGSIVCVFSINK